MYLLYLDESGNPDDASDRHFVLAGLAVFERRTYWMQQAAEIIKATHFPTAPPLDFHAQAIRNGKGLWRHTTPEVRAEVLADVGNIMARAPQAECVLFGVVEKPNQVHGDEAIRLALEQVCKRFDTLLKRKHVGEIRSVASSFSHEVTTSSALKHGSISFVDSAPNGAS